MADPNPTGANNTLLNVSRSYVVRQGEQAVLQLREAMTQLRVLSQIPQAADQQTEMRIALQEMREEVTQLVRPSQALQDYLTQVGTLLQEQITALTEVERIQRGAFRKGYLGPRLLELHALLIARRNADQWNSHILDRLILYVDNPFVQGLSVPPGHADFAYQHDLAVYARVLQMMGEIRGLCASWAADNADEGNDNDLSFDALNVSGAVAADPDE